MRKKIATTEDIKAHLFSTMLPEETLTYKPISHENVYRSIKEILKLNNMELDKENFISADSGRVMFGEIIFHDKPKEEEIEKGTEEEPEEGVKKEEEPTLEDLLSDIPEEAKKYPIPGMKKPEKEEKLPDVRHVISIQNSYNKRFKLRIAYGMEYKGAVILSQSINFDRKHIGSIVKEFQDTVSGLIVQVGIYGKELAKLIDMYNVFLLTENTAYRTLGEIFFAEEILYSEQMSKAGKLLKKQFKETSVISLWDFYTIITKVLRTLHASLQIERKMQLYDYLKRTFGVIETIDKAAAA